MGGRLVGREAAELERIAGAVVSAHPGRLGAANPTEAATIARRQGLLPD